MSERVLRVVPAGDDGMVKYVILHSPMQFVKRKTAREGERRVEREDVQFISVRAVGGSHAPVERGFFAAV